MKLTLVPIEKSLALKANCGTCLFDHGHLKVRPHKSPTKFWFTGLQLSTTLDILDSQSSM